MKTTPFVTGLRTRGAPLDLTGGSAGDGPVWTVRVQLLEAWDAVAVRVRPTTRLAEVVRAALTALAGADADPAAFDCKLRGVRLADATVTLTAAGVLDGSTLLLVHAARRPVR